MIQTPNNEYKIVLVGDSAVGKSSILSRFVDDCFNESLLSTIGVDFKFRKIALDGQEIKLQIWDTAGQEIFRAIVSAYYSSADAIIAVYDVSSYDSFENLKEYWLKEIEDNNRNGAKVFIIGNKTDLPKRDVQTFSVQNLLSTHPIAKAYEVSAKSATNVETAFTDITRILHGLKPIKSKSDSRPNKKVEEAPKIKLQKPKVSRPLPASNSANNTSNNETNEISKGSEEPKKPSNPNRNISMSKQCCPT